MISSTSTLKRSAISGVMTLIKANAATTVRSSIYTTARRYQSSSSSSPSSSDLSKLDFLSIVKPERQVNAASMDRVDLAHGSFFALHRPLLGLTHVPVDTRINSFSDFEESVEDLNNYFSSLRPYSPPNSSSNLRSTDSKQTVQEFFHLIERQQQSRLLNVVSITPPTIGTIMDEMDDTNVMHMTSVLRKRRIKMRKHKYKKLRKRTRALRKKLASKK
ncbi:hypothetical protein BCR41DRAFT_356792 [Lobosporangium transversale]|uniref:Small ribosomal subunit protein mS38 n=1 Tax=Lobosporangium transversale TaxID=64571 RepID=A0A1Y2GJS9_9FUNG|nr:hypothetical protein BCR41DRAFT_356792 [Lobosporangium transversale]ORZ11705.1 hypothetical protein BCR41DRAFT_356792 [Lobosporangium transversale]|eukprot:XP_021879802.1 hypothetical protein BCR41DRAFT_356792 [Lobosporangium transversale]